MQYLHVISGLNKKEAEGHVRPPASGRAAPNRATLSAAPLAAVCAEPCLTQTSCQISLPRMALLRPELHMTGLGQPVDVAIVVSQTSLTKEPDRFGTPRGCLHPAFGWQNPPVLVTARGCGLRRARRVRVDRSVIVAADRGAQQKQCQKTRNLFLVGQSGLHLRRRKTCQCKRDAQHSGGQCFHQHHLFLFVAPQSKAAGMEQR